MTAWRYRVLITAAAAVLGAAVGIWWQRASPSRRIVADEAEMAAAIMECYAAETYSPTGMPVVGWADLAVGPGPGHVWSSKFGDNTVVVTNLWGGYSAIVADLEGDTLYDGIWYYYRRERNGSSRRWAADRGWAEVYTNAGSTERLLDLGPAGGAVLLGTTNYPARVVPAGGWLFYSESSFPAHFRTLPPYDHLTNRWFLTLYATTGESGNDYLTGTRLLQPRTWGGASNVIAATFTAESDRWTFWDPVLRYCVTNQLAAAPLRARFWGAASEAYTTNLDYRTPEIVCAPTSPFVDPNWPLHRMTLHRAGLWADYARALDMADFTGWTNPSLPDLSLNADYAVDYAAWTNFCALYIWPEPARESAAWTSNAWYALGNTIGHRRVRSITGTWSNIVERTFRFATPNRVRSDYGSDAAWYSAIEADYAAAKSTGVWELVTEDFSAGTAGPYYQMDVAGEGIPGSMWLLQLDYAYLHTGWTAAIGHGHATNAAPRLAAHVFPVAYGTFYAPPDNTYSEDAMYAFETATDYEPPVWAGAVHLPDFTNDPPDAMWPTWAALTNGGFGAMHTGWRDFWNTEGPSYRGPRIAAELGRCSFANYPTGD